MVKEMLRKEPRAVKTIRLEHRADTPSPSLRVRLADRAMRLFAVAALAWALISRWPRIQDLLNQFGSGLHLNQHGIPQVFSGPWSYLADYLAIMLLAAGLLLVTSVVYVLRAED
jgi:hypothetical protein